MKSAMIGFLLIGLCLLLNSTARAQERDTAVAGGLGLKVRITDARVSVWAGNVQRVTEDGRVAGERAPDDRMWLKLNVEIGVERPPVKLTANQIRIRDESGGAYPLAGTALYSISDVYLHFNEPIKGGSMTYTYPVRSEFLKVSRNKKTEEVELEFLQQEIVGLHLLFSVPRVTRGLSIQVGDGQPVEIPAKAK